MLPFVSKNAVKRLKRRALENTSSAIVSRHEPSLRHVRHRNAGDESDGEHDRAQPDGRAESLGGGRLPAPNPAISISGKSVRRGSAICRGGGEVLAASAMRCQLQHLRRLEAQRPTVPRPWHRDRGPELDCETAASSGGGEDRERDDERAPPPVGDPHRDEHSRSPSRPTAAAARRFGTASCPYRPGRRRRRSTITRPSMTNTATTTTIT